MCIRDRTSVATLRGGRVAPDDDCWRAVKARIELDPRFSEAAHLGLDGFFDPVVVFPFRQFDCAPALDMKPAMRGFEPARRAPTARLGRRNHARPLVRRCNT